MLAPLGQLALPMASAIDSWIPNRLGGFDIDWLLIPERVTRAYFSVPVWISSKAHDQCLNGLLPHHYPKDEAERLMRFQQVICGTAIRGRISLRGAGNLDTECECRWSPVPNASELTDRRHDFSVKLSVSQHRLFNNDLVVLICLWDERHRTTAREIC